jgi:hypothetical protein
MGYESAAGIRCGKPIQHHKIKANSLISPYFIVSNHLRLYIVPRKSFHVIENPVFLRLKIMLVDDPKDVP